jgi:hypothetical protein
MSYTMQFLKDLNDVLRLSLLSSNVQLPTSTSQGFLWHPRLQEETIEFDYRHKSQGSAVIVISFLILQLGEDSDKLGCRVNDEDSSNLLPYIY